MAGGIDAWNGIVAEGDYDSGLAYFSRASGAEELISLSWALEEGNRVFYEHIAGESGEGEDGSLFRSLVLAEERHKETLRELYVLSFGRDTDPVPPEGVEAGGFLEGGIPLGEALTRTRGKPLREILELAVAMEANALDRYVKMGRAVEDERSRKVFLALAGEERAHLTRMASVLDRISRKE
jgi:sulfur-carrier protein adenylyltransferase/sulfurtransferase